MKKFTIYHGDGSQEIVEAAKKAQAKAVAALQQFELSAISQAHYIQHEAPGNYRA